MCVYIPTAENVTLGLASTWSYHCLKILPHWYLGNDFSLLFKFATLMTGPKLLFMCVFIIGISSSSAYLFRSFAHFKNQVVGFKRVCSCLFSFSFFYFQASLKFMILLLLPSNVIEEAHRIGLML